MTSTNVYSWPDRAPRRRPQLLFAFSTVPAPSPATLVPCPSCGGTPCPGCAGTALTLQEQS